MKNCAAVIIKLDLVLDKNGGIGWGKFIGIKEGVYEKRAEELIRPLAN